MLEYLFLDLRHAARSLARRPSLLVIVTLTLGLGIGATTAIFSLLNANLLRPLPFPDSDRLVMLYLTRATDGGGTNQLRWSYPKLHFFRQSATQFESVAGFTRADVNLTGSGDPDRVVAEIVSSSYFPALRVDASLGRTFLPEEDSEPGAHPVVLLSHGLWVRRFGADRSIVGSRIGINSVSLAIIGVLPPDFGGLSGRADLWVPSVMAPLLTYSDYLSTPQNFINAVARLRPGVTLSQVNSEVDLLGRRIDQAFPAPSQVPARYGATLVPLNTARIDPATRRSTLVLFGSVSCVLLIACVNIASLLLGRACSRQRELAVRIALGSSRWRLLRHLLAESVLLALPGGAAGLLCAAWFADALTSLAPGLIATPRNDYAQIAEFGSPAIDLRVLCFTALASLLTGVACGLLPALRSSRPDLISALQEGARGSSQVLGSLGHLASLPVLVVTEVALALVLLTCAGLLIQSFERMQAVDPGFQPHNLISFWVNPPESKYRPAEGPAIVERVLTRVSSLPGVRAATVSRCAPYMSTCARTTLFLAGQPEPPPGAAPVVGRHYVGPDHFKTLGIPLLRGRSFTPEDRAGRPAATIINQAAARRFWPGQDPIGKRVWFGSGTGFNSRETPVEIVGIVGDVRYWPPEEPPGPDFYTCYLQFTYPSTMVFLRAGDDGRVLIPSVRSAILSVDKDLPIYDIKTMADRSGEALARPRYHALLTGSFAAAALVLAALGIYGVMAFSVSTRTREIGIRMALGAEPPRILALVLRESLRLTLAGVVLGIAGSLAATRLLSGMLYGVRPADPLTVAVVSGLLLACSALASFLPARRAATVEPVSALRHE